MDPSDTTGNTLIEEKTVKEALYDVWRITMGEQSKTILRYGRNGKSLFRILKGQVDATTIGKLGYKSEYEKVQDDEDVIGLLDLIKETCANNQGGTMTDGLTKLIRSQYYLLPGNRSIKERRDYQRQSTGIFYVITMKLQSRSVVNIYAWNQTTRVRPKEGWKDIR